MLTELPEGVTVEICLPRDTPGPSLQPGISTQPVLEADSAAEPCGQPSVLHGSISADNTALKLSASMAVVVARSRSSGSWSASRDIPSVYQEVLAESSTIMESYQTDQDRNSFMIPEMERGLEFTSWGPPIAGSWTEEPSFFNFQLDSQSRGAFTSFGPKALSKPFLFYRFSQQCFSYSHWQADLATPYDSMMGMIMPAGRNYENQASITLVGSAQLFLPRFVPGISRHGSHGTHRPLPTAEELVENLESLVSIEDMGVFCELLQVLGDNVHVTDRFVQLLLFAIANKFAGIDNIPIKVIMTFMYQHEPLRYSIPSYLAKGESTIFSSALTEKLLHGAIEAGDAKAVHDLLMLKVVKPDDIICMEGTHRWTPLERASTMRHFEMMRLLLRFGADVNKTYYNRTPWKEHGALECAIRLHGEYCPIDLQIVDLLLDNGATVSSRLAGAVIRWGDTRLIEKIMSGLPQSEHVDCFSGMLTEAAEYLKNNTGLRIVQQILKACRDMHNGICIRSRQRILAEVMASAARKQNKELVSFLLPHGGQEGLDRALAGAVRSGSHSLVHLLIGHGARADAPAYRSPYISPYRSPNTPANCIGDTFEFISTPLAEAIRADDVELVELLSREGAWNQIGERGRLEPALDAVAVSGSLVYLAKILQLVPHPDPEALAGPLNAAIIAGHEEVALRMMRVGADVNQGPTRDKMVGPALLESLRKKSRTIFWAILEFDVNVNYHLFCAHRCESALELATAWGDPQIIRALVFMGADINVCKKELPLIMAIRAGDRSLIDFLISLGADLHSTQPDQNSPEGELSRLSPLAAAVLVQNEEITTYLLDQGADPADETAFINAAMHDRGLLKLVFEAFGKRYPKGCVGFGGRVLNHALNTQDDALLELCLSANFDVNALTFDQNYEPEVSALGWAIRKCRDSSLELISKLLDARGDANVITSQRFFHVSRDTGLVESERRQTALLDAIEMRSFPLVKFLISKGANAQMEAKWSLERTPLQKACEVQSHTIVDFLLKSGANVNAAPAVCEGATALQCAAKAGSTRIAKTLLTAGAEVNAPGAQRGGHSAIYYAARYGRAYMIQVLWNAPGARFTADECERASAVARGNGHPACVALIKKLSSGSQGSIDA
ncbi:hypothetical protein NPX13_g8350 [Xylaria arbuscula]|uniref:Uncharacterized protein n=1 Tax=Xylaria arbuscula TaxID=114810 RepID=A0A9W8N8C2_9PEZI|nr:hypothetical protein NPX13_g8350 [Xylaria arbuscula]